MTHTMNHILKFINSKKSSKLKLFFSNFSGFYFKIEHCLDAIARKINHPSFFFELKFNTSKHFRSNFGT